MTRKKVRIVEDGAATGHPPRRKNGCKKNSGGPHPYKVVERRVWVAYEDKSYRKAGFYIGEDYRCPDCGKYVMTPSRLVSLDTAVAVLGANSTEPFLEIKQ
jgi:hypothetical protein